MDVAEDVLDFLAFLFLLGICLAVAFGVVLPVVYESSDNSATVISDKTAPTQEGYKLATGFDGTYSQMEAVLITQVQDPQIPAPSHYKVKGLDVGIDRIYRADLQNLGAASFDQLKSDGPSARYKIGFNYGPTSSPKDDYYEFLKQ